MAKILIPTPLRQYTDKKDTIELSGAYRRRVAEARSPPSTPTCASICSMTKANFAAS